MHRHRRHPAERDAIGDAMLLGGTGDSTVARTLAVVSFLGFALHYRYGTVVLDLVAFTPSNPLHHFGFPILASALGAFEPTALIVALVGFVLCAAPLERRIGGSWTFALFFWGHLAGIGAQLTLGAKHLTTYRTWGPNAGILALLVASAVLARHFRKVPDRDFEVESAPAPRAPWLWLLIYVAGTLVCFAIDRAGSLGISGEASLAGMAVGGFGAWAYRSGSSLVKLFAAAGTLARTALIVMALLAGTANRQVLLDRFAAKTKGRPTVAAAGFEPVVAAEVSREPSAAERKLDSFLDKELGERELVFATLDPNDRTFAFAGGALWVSNRWVPAAMLWDDEGFSAAGGGVTVRIRKPDVEGRVAVLVNDSPIEAWPGSRLSALRLREIAQKGTSNGR